MYTTVGTNRLGILSLLLMCDILVLALLVIISPAKVLVGGLSLICFTAIIIHSRGLIYFLILTSPLITAITKISPELNSIRILFTLALIVFFLGRFWLQGQKFISIPKEILRPVLVLLLYLIITMFLAINPVKAIVDFTHLLYYLIIFYAVYNIYSSGIKNRLVNNIFIIMISAYSLIILASYGIGVHRVGLLGMNPNSFALLLLIGFGYSMLTFYNSADLRQKFIALIGIILISLAAFIAGSRGGWLMFVVFWSVYMILIGRKRYVAIAGIAGFVLLIFLYSNLSIYLNYARDTRIFSGLTGRPELWKGGIQVISNYPIFGTGMGCVGEVLRYHVHMANPLIPLFTHIPVPGRQPA